MTMTSVGSNVPTLDLSFQIVVGSICSRPTVSYGAVSDSVSNSQGAATCRVKVVSSLSYRYDGYANVTVAISLSYDGHSPHDRSPPIVLVWVQVVNE